MPVIELQTTIKAEQTIVFDLSRSIDLHQVSTRQTYEIAIAGRTSGLIRHNEQVTWRAKHFGIYQNLTSKITEFNSPTHFTDEMVSGTFKRFKHKHIFDKKENEIVMTDIFDYTSPLGLLGKLADILFLKNYMTNLLAVRNNTIKHYAETDLWKQILDEKKYC